MIISRDKKLLCPAFAERLIEHDRLMAIQHLPFHDYECLRSWEIQAEYYERGRTTPGPPCVHSGIVRPIGTCPDHPLGCTVTNARPGESWHQFGLATDKALDLNIEKPGIQWSWDTKRDLNKNGTNDWLEMGSLAEMIGLEWSGRWRKFPELPHIQMTGGLRIQDAQELFRVGGLDAVWNEVRA